MGINGIELSLNTRLAIYSYIHECLITVKNYIRALVIGTHI